MRKLIYISIVSVILMTVVNGQCGVVAGKVLDLEDKPVEEARVSMRLADKTVVPDEQDIVPSIQTDKDGNFCFSNVTEKVYELIVSSPFSKNNEIETSVYLPVKIDPASESNKNLIVKPTKVQKLLLHGEIISETLLIGVRARLRRLEPPLTVRLLGGDIRKVASIDPDNPGNFVMDGFLPGEYWMKVNLEANSPLNIKLTIKSDGTVELDDKSLAKLEEKSVNLKLWTKPNMSEE